MMIWRQTTGKSAGRLLDRYVRGRTGGAGLGPRAPQGSGPTAADQTAPVANPAETDGSKPPLS